MMFKKWLTCPNRGKRRAQSASFNDTMLQDIQEVAMNVASSMLVKDFFMGDWRLEISKLILLGRIVKVFVV